LRERGVVLWPRAGAPEPLRVETAELVGAYGMSVVWNDGHSTGIFSWEMLRGSCPCAVCVVPRG
ncbi:MAG: gamma-butyrobetaine hydroxylase-like domain-containing protein, partial [Acidimicrobiia bacterium]